jgi:radical SAM superfamily enzyme
MSLTKDDLKAIQNIIDTRVPIIIDERVQPILEEFEERLKIQMETGLQEVRNQVSNLQASVNRIEVTVDSIERVQQAELERNDKQDVAIKKIRKALHAA